MLELVLQLRGVGAELPVAATIVVLSLLSIVLSLAIAVVLVRGYLAGPGQRGVLWLAVGLLLLTTVPELLRIGLPTATGIGTIGRSIVVSSCELIGLGVILGSIYRSGSR